jgi:hypothetical protein
VVRAIFNTGRFFALAKVTFICNVSLLNTTYRANSKAGHTANAFILINRNYATFLMKTEKQY